MKSLSSALAFLIAFESAALPAFAGSGGGPSPSRGQASPSITRLTTAPIRIRPNLDPYVIDVAIAPLDDEGVPYESYEVLEEYVHELYVDSYAQNPSLETHFIIDGEAQAIVEAEGLTGALQRIAQAAHATPETLAPASRGSLRTRLKGYFEANRSRLYWSLTRGTTVGGAIGFCLRISHQPLSVVLTQAIVGGLASTVLQYNTSRLSDFLAGTRRDPGTKEILFDPETGKPFSTYWVDAYLKNKGVTDPQKIKLGRFVESLLRHLPFDLGYAFAINAASVAVSSSYAVNWWTLMADAGFNMISQGSYETLTSQDRDKKLLEIQRDVESAPEVKRALANQVLSKTARRFLYISAITTALFIAKTVELPLATAAFYGAGSLGLGIRLGLGRLYRKILGASDCKKMLAAPAALRQSDENP